MRTTEGRPDDRPTTRDKLKAAHMQAADERWEAAIEDARRFLCYDRRTYPSFQATEATDAHDAKVREFARLMFSVCGQTRFKAFGGLGHGFGLQMNSYTGEVGYSAVALMEFVRYFIGHEILDDGEPGIGYYRSVMMDRDHPGESYVLCGPDHEDALPYFHRSIDVLRTYWHGRVNPGGHERWTVKSGVDLGRADYQAEDTFIPVEGAPESFISETKARRWLLSQVGACTPPERLDFVPWLNPQPKVM